MDIEQARHPIAPFPEIDLEQQKIGIFGKFVKLNAVPGDGERIEIYRPIICDPKTVHRRPKAEGAADDSDG